VTCVWRRGQGKQISECVSHVLPGGRLGRVEGCNSVLVDKNMVNDRLQRAVLGCVCVIRFGGGVASVGRAERVWQVSDYMSHPACHNACRLGRMSRRRLDFGASRGHFGGTMPACRRWHVDFGSGCRRTSGHVPALLRRNVRGWRRSRGAVSTCGHVDMRCDVRGGSCNRKLAISRSAVQRPSGQRLLPRGGRDMLRGRCDLRQALCEHSYQARAVPGVRFSEAFSDAIRDESWEILRGMRGTLRGGSM
jgi:hypothetical protein